MDPKINPQSSNPTAPTSTTPPPAGGMDPKLQEAYNKVMNFSVPSTPTPAASPTQPNLDSQINTPSSAPLNTTISAPSVPPPVMSPESLPTPSPVTSKPAENTVMVGAPATPATSPAPTTTTQALKAKKKGSLVPLFLGIGAVIFVAIYTVIWIKIFNINVPYINP